MTQEFNTYPEWMSYWRTALTEKSTTLKERYLGELRYVNTSTGTKIYKYVMARAACAKGAPVSYVSNNQGRVTNAAAAINSTRPAGIVTTAFSTSQYCWIQTRGFNAYALTDKAVKRGDPLVKDEATAGMLDTQAVTAAGTQFGWKVVGVALETDSGSVCPGMMIDCYF